MKLTLFLVNDALIIPKIVVCDHVKCEQIGWEQIIIIASSHT